MGYGVDFFFPMVLADPLETGFDVESSIECCPVVFGHFQLADSVDGDEDSVARPGEVVDCINFDGWECEDLVVY